MLFKKEMANLILDGFKTQTRRFSLRRPARPGSLHYAQTKLYDKDSRFARLKILEVEKWNGYSISHEDALAEGFMPGKDFEGRDNRQRFLDYYNHINAHASRKTERKHWAIVFAIEETYYPKATVTCACGDHYRTYFNDPLCWICLSDEDPDRAAP